ncbi:hypothetical protein IEQ34_012098 [Dendrobium chrysotoxum]|uniref:Uncharacterized protein n=1 Tax=Dendrobium chrysotoxum TaxID=161865 RepID=A0AAV7GBX9_DENCH|nr:hypothetical protein IEQ34_012098 [Dendrobium chrysotoxum]
MAKKLLICFVLSFSLILPTSSSQQPSKCMVSLSQSQVKGSWISGRKLLEEIIVPAAILLPKLPDKLERFEAKTGSKGGHENREEEEEGKGMVFTADYNKVKTHSSPLPNHPKP